MKRAPSLPCRLTASVVVLGASVVVVAACLSACAAHLASRDLYRAEQVRIEHENYVMNPVLVTPVSPRHGTLLVVFASGDGGLRGVSKTILQHLADRGDYVAGFSSREALHAIKGSRDRIGYAEAIKHLAWMSSAAKAKLMLPPDTPTIVTGMSRGANMVILAASNSAMKQTIAGAVAIALTRELDNISLPEAALALPGVQVDEKQRPQTYPAIERIGTIPLAIIQSTNDSYVPSAQSRQMLGPDTPTRRLYEVKSSGHSFGGGEAEMLRDLDEALDWIVSRKSN